MLTGHLPSVDLLGMRKLSGALSPFAVSLHKNKKKFEGLKAAPDTPSCEHPGRQRDGMKNG